MSDTLKSAEKQILGILQGIDKEEIADVDGWWQTSGGARFGAEKLSEIRKVFDRLAVSVASKHPAHHSQLR